MPSRIATIGEGQNQNLSRKVKIFFDQHRNAAQGFPEGRPWWGYCERQVDGSDAKPVAELVPVSADIQLPDGTNLVGWDAPWTPEPKYINMAVSYMVGNRFQIDYVRMQRDYENASRTYYDLVNNEMHAKGWDPVPLYASVPYVVRALKHIGAPPKSPKLPQAALAGDRWLLGWTDIVNEQLKATLDTDNGRLSYTPAEETVRRPSVELAASELPLLSEEDQADLMEFLRQRRAMKHARDAKAEAIK